MTLARRVASASLQLAASNVTVKLLALATIPVLTRLLSPDAYGVATIAITLMSLLAVVALAGLDMSYMRALNDQKFGSAPAVEGLIWRFVLASALAVGLVGGGLFWYFVAAPYWGLPRELAVLVGVGATLLMINTMATTRARLQGRYGPLALATVIGGVAIAGVGIGVAFWWRRDGVPLILAALAGFVVPVLILGIPRLGVLFKSSGIGGVTGRKILAIGLAGTFTAPMYWVVSSSDRWFLAYVEGAASAGIYAVGYSIGVMGMVFNSAIQLAWLPEVSREYAENKQGAPEVLGRVSEDLIVAVGLLWLAVTAGGGDLIRLLVAESFYPAAEIVPFVAAGTFFYAIVHMASTTLLVVGRLNDTLAWWLVGGLLCLASNALLVPQFGRLGAAVAQTLVFAVVAAGILVSAQRRFPLTLRLPKIATLLALIVVGGIAMARPWSSNPLFSLLAKMPVILVIAVIAIHQVRKDAVMTLLRMLNDSARRLRSGSV